MKNGQLYGSLGVGGHAQVYTSFYDELVDQHVRGIASKEKRNMQYETLAKEYSRMAERSLRTALSAREKAQGKTKLSAGQISQLFLAEFKINDKLIDVQLELDKSNLESDLLAKEEINEIENKYNQDNDTDVATNLRNISNAFVNLVAEQDATEQGVTNAIDSAITLIESDLDLPVDEMGQKLAKVQRYRTHMANELRTKLKSTAPAAISIADEKLRQKFSIPPVLVTDEDGNRLFTGDGMLNDQGLPNREYVEYLKLQEINQVLGGTSLSADVQNLSDLLNTAQSVRKSILGDDGAAVDETAKNAAYIFSRPELIRFFDKQQELDFQLPAEQVAELVAQETGVDADRVMGLYNRAVRYNNEDKAYVPEQYIDNLTEGFVEAKKDEAQARSKIDTVDTKTPNFEVLAAQRFLATQPKPAALINTFAELRADPSEKIAFARGRRLVEAQLQSNPDYKIWYNNLSPEEQAMQAYSIASTYYYRNMKGDEPKPKGKIQKQVMTMFEANSEMDANEMIRKTAELFRNPEERDQARAYYAALRMNKASQVSPTDEVAKIAQEPIETPKMTPTNLPHSMFEFPFPASMERQRDRQFNRTMRQLERDEAIREMQENMVFNQLDRRLNIASPAFNRADRRIERMYGTDPEMQEAMQQFEQQEVGDGGALNDFDLNAFPMTPKEELEADYALQYLKNQQ